MKSRSGNTTTLSGNVGTAALAIPTPRTPAQPMASAPVSTVAAVRFTRLTRLALRGRAGRRWAPGVLDELVLTVPPRKPAVTGDLICCYGRNRRINPDGHEPKVQALPRHRPIRRNSDVSGRR